MGIFVDTWICGLQKIIHFEITWNFNSLTFKFVVQLTGEIHKNKCPTNNNECTVHNLYLKMKENKLGKRISQFGAEN